MVAFTEKVGLPKPADNESSWGTGFRSGMDSAEARLTKSFTGNPNTNVSGQWVGQLCWDSANGMMYACTAVGDSATATWQLVLPTRPYARGYIDGFQLSRSPGDTEHDLLIGTGACRSQDNLANIDLAAALTKQLDGSWQVGTNQGMIQSGFSIAANTFYDINVIRRNDTGVCDVQATPNGETLVLPTNYDSYRHIGYWYTGADANLVALFQEGDFFLYDQVQLDFDDQVTATAQLVELSVPPNSYPILVFHGADGGTTRYVLISSPAQTDREPSSTEFNAIVTASGRTVTSFDGTFKVNAASRIRIRCNNGTPDMQLVTRGWRDPRGKL